MTFIIVIFTLAISIRAFYNKDMDDRLIFKPYQVYHRLEWYRIITHGFLHAGWMHLIINMLVLLSFGGTAEFAFNVMAQTTRMNYPNLCYLTFYILSIVISSLTTLYKHMDHEWYSSVGASGAVLAVLFCSIFFDPKMTLLIMGIIPIKAYLFGPLYLLYSWYSARKANDNINHDAHLMGAVFGFCFPLIVDVSLFRWFIDSLFR